MLTYACGAAYTVDLTLLLLPNLSGRLVFTFLCLVIFGKAYVRRLQNSLQNVLKPLSDRLFPAFVTPRPTYPNGCCDVGAAWPELCKAMLVFSTQACIHGIGLRHGEHWALMLFSMQALSSRCELYLAPGGCWRRVY